MNADLVLIDEKLGRKVAFERGLEIIDTIGVLSIGRDRGWVDFDSSLEKLENADFYISTALKEQITKP